MSKRITITVSDELQAKIDRAMKEYGFSRQSEAVAFMASAFWNEHDTCRSYADAIAAHYKKTSDKK